VAERNYFDTKFWKIAPGRNAEFWEEWKRDGIISVGWSDFGDLSSVKKKADFDRIAEEYLKRHPEDTRIGISQVWKFINSIKIGDRVVANEGTRKALGIGTVTGKYLYEPKYLYSHVIPVIWDDLGQRSVAEPSWVKTLIELPRDKFEAIEKTVSAEPSVSRNYNEVSERLRSYYPDGEDLRRICSIFAEAVEKAHGESPSGWCTTLLNDRLRLNVGRAATLDCLPGRLRISVLVGDLPQGAQEKWKEFEKPFFSFNSLDEKTTGYELPWGEVAVSEELVKELLDSFIAKASSKVKKTPYGAFHEPRILDAVSEVLEKPLPSPEYGEISGAGKSFSARAFSLLEMLFVRPEVGTYLEHLGDYEREVEAPVRQLMEKVAASLGEEVKDTLETEKDLFTRIPKKEGQKGGVWPHYGGAFYPKGSNRGEGVQVFLLLTHEGLRAGLSFGDGRIEEKSRFERNLRSYGNKLMELLASRWQTPLLTVEENGRESREAIPFLLRWISEPEQMGGYRLVRFWEKEELIETEQEDLAREIQILFTDLFPFVLLALKEEPLAAIGEWYGVVQPISLPQKTRPSYTLNEVAENTGYPVRLLERWKQSLLRKKQAVFYGPPGTGKTFIAKEIARHLIDGGKGLAEVVQFHPSYAYEDFIEGIRPAVKGEADLVYEVKPGTFLEFCRKAEEVGDDPCVLIVDEINRAPLSRVFGELMYLLEYRGETVNLASGRRFSIPGNVFLIGTMNTADRSIALVDHALRRRFAFISLFPRYEVLAHYHERHSTGFDCDGLVRLLVGLNKAIGDPNFSIGVSFFMRENLAQELEDIWRMEVEPYLEEYFYEKNGMVDDFRWEKVRSSILPE
jgi:5-methylcytosine-specific restriction protein B